MAITHRIHRIDIYDANPGGPVNVDVHRTIESSEATTAGLPPGSEVLRGTAPRAAIVALLGQVTVRTKNGDALASALTPEKLAP